MIVLLFLGVVILFLFYGGVFGKENFIKEVFLLIVGFGFGVLFVVLFV